MKKFIILNHTKFRDQEIIQSSSDYSSSFDGRIAKLVLRRMSDSKSGLYKCFAKSDYGEAQSSAMLKFELTGNFFDIYLSGL